jgi:hypothetical protein
LIIMTLYWKIFCLSVCLFVCLRKL